MTTPISCAESVEQGATSNPYFISGPALISNSMGRTSGKMLHDILDAHDGQLPPDVYVVTANTGDEDPKSIRFRREQIARWNVPQIMVEYRNNDAGYEIVGDNSMSMSGEPFDMLIEKKANERSPQGYVPNRGAPYCSIELKGRTIRDFVYGELGWKRWTTVLGLRHDEQPRVMGAIGRNHSGKDPWRNAMPIDKAKGTKRDVMRFWCGSSGRFDPTVPEELLPQGFDLGLWPMEDNCTFCWKKSMPKRRRLIRLAIDRNDTAMLTRWIQRERRTGTTFDLKWSMEEIVRSVIDEPDFLDTIDDHGDDASEECGFSCFLSDAEQMELAA